MATHEEHPLARRMGDLAMRLVDTVCATEHDTPPLPPEYAAMALACAGIEWAIRHCHEGREEASVAQFVALLQKAAPIRIRQVQAFTATTEMKP
jgi:hypothetical protein